MKYRIKCKHSSFHDGKIVYKAQHKKFLFWKAISPTAPHLHMSQALSDIETFAKSLTYNTNMDSITVRMIHGRHLPRISCSRRKKQQIPKPVVGKKIAE